MRCLTIRQPYASLIAHGIKWWETRTWATTYRGPVAIHAAKTPATWHELDEPSLMSERETVQAILTAFGVVEAGGKTWPTPWITEDTIYLGWEVTLPLGAVIAVAGIADCLPIEDYDTESDTLPAVLIEDTRRLTYCDPNGAAGEGWYRERNISDQLPYGNWEPGNWAWQLDNVRHLPEPIPARGRQGLWLPHGHPLPDDPDGDLQTEIERALEQVA